MDEDIRIWLISIFEKGKRSPFLNKFISEVTIFGIQYLMTKVPKFVREKLCKDNTIDYDDENQRVETLAAICIADFFEFKDGKFIKLENFISKKSIDPDNTPNEIVISKLRTFVWNTLHNRIFDMDKNYARTRRALNNVIARNTSYTRLEKDVDYIFSCPEDQIDFSLPQIENNELTGHLLTIKLVEPNNPKLIESVFDYINNQNEFNKAIEYGELVKCIFNYYMKTFNDLIGSDNVKYKEGKEEGSVTKIEKVVQPLEYSAFEDNFKGKFWKEIDSSRIYKTKEYLKILYVYRKKYDFDRELYSIYRILVSLYSLDLDDIKISIILENIFDVLHAEKLYNKAIKYNSLLKLLLMFYRPFLKV